MRVGVVGTGWMAKRAVQEISAIPGNEVQVVAVASRTVERAKAFAVENGLDGTVGIYDRYDGMSSNDNVDLVYIATTNESHYTLAKHYIRAGKPVLCEKPMTLTHDECVELCRFAFDRGVFLAEAMWIRFVPMLNELAEYLKTGAIGEVRSCTASLSYNIADKERIREPKLGGGTLYDLGVYCLAFNSMFMGPISGVSTSMADTLDTGVESTVHAVLRHQGQKTSVVMTSVDRSDPRYGIIHGTDGYVVVDSVGYPMKAMVYGADHRMKKVFTAGNNHPYIYEFLAVADALAQKKLQVDQFTHADSCQSAKIIDVLSVR